MSNANIQKYVADILRKNKELIAMGKGEELYDVLTDSLTNVNNIYPYISTLTDILTDVVGAGGMLVMFNSSIPTGAFFYYDFPVSTLTIPNNITAIRTSAFSNAGGYKELHAQGVKELYLHSFMNNRELLTAYFPNIESIGVSAFHGCLNLDEIRFGDNLQVIGNGAFEGCAISEIYLPKSIHTIGHSAFKDTPLKDIYYDGTVEEFKKLSKKCVGWAYKAGEHKKKTIHCVDGEYVV